MTTKITCNLHFTWVKSIYYGIMKALIHTNCENAAVSRAKDLILKNFL